MRSSESVVQDDHPSSVLHNRYIRHTGGKWPQP